MEIRKIITLNGLPLRFDKMEVNTFEGDTSIYLYLGDCLITSYFLDSKKVVFERMEDSILKDYKYAHFVLK